MFLGNLFSREASGFEGPPRPNFMDRLSSKMEDPRRQAFLQASLDLMRSGGYSDRPVSLPQALGAAGSNGIKTYHDAMRRKAEKERREQQRLEKASALKREQEKQVYQRRLDEQEQTIAKEAQALKTKDVQSEIQHRRETDARKNRESSVQAALYRQLMGGETQSMQPSLSGGPPLPPQISGVEPPAPPPAPAPLAEPTAQPLFQPGSDVPSPPVAMASSPPADPVPHPEAEMPEPGEPPDRPLPGSAASPAGPASKPLTTEQLVGAKMLGIDLSKIYEYQHGDRLSFEQTAARERAKKASSDLKALSKTQRETTTLKHDFMDLQQRLKSFSGSGMTDLRIKLAQWGEGIGITLDPRLDDKQAAKALINQVTLKMRGLMGGMPGQLSDKDIAFLKAMAPRLSNTEEGRDMIIERFIGMLNKTETYTRFAQRWISQYGSLEHQEPESGLSFEGVWHEYQKEAQ